MLSENFIQRIHVNKTIAFNDIKDQDKKFLLLKIGYKNIRNYSELWIISLKCGSC